MVPFIAILHFAQADGLLVFTPMNDFRQVNAAWSKDGLDMLFTFGDSDPESMHFYYVPRSDLLTEKGRDYWMRHMAEKTWFTAKLRQKVAALIEEAKK